MQERNKLRLKVQKSRAEKLKKEQETLQAHALNSTRTQTRLKETVGRNREIPINVAEFTLNSSRSYSL